MDLYNLGKVPWHESQLIYHALAKLGREALSLVSPATPYVCIGYHQDAEQEVDLDYCRRTHIPVFRREVGGGAVYLDGNQLFFQLVLHRDNPAMPKRRESFYRKFLQPVIHAYRHIGIPAEYKPINDVICGTRKISGTGVGEIGECVVFVGNLILDFNYEMMARVLRVPDEKFRDKVHKTLKENLSTIRGELGEEALGRWDETRLNSLLIKGFEELLGPMALREKDQVLQIQMGALAQRMMTDEWLHQKGRRVSIRDVKIRAGVNVVHKMVKAPGGLLRADFQVTEGKYSHVSLSGDFFCFPETAVATLESALEGRPVSEARKILECFYKDNEVETPGIVMEDWIEVLTVGSHLIF
ncbi:MAG: lipoate--protein ligase family protein [Pseudomonadota bacterium]